MPTRRGEWTERQVKALTQMKREGLPEVLISERLGRSVNAVNSKWRNMQQEVASK